MKLGHYLDGKHHCYIMHLSFGRGTDEDRRAHWTFGRDSHLVGLDRSDVNMDWNNKTETEKEEFRSESPIWYQQFEMFCSKMTKGDLVVVLAGLDSILGVGIVSRADYFYCPKFKEDGTFFDHVRNVNWLKDWDFDDVNRPKPPRSLGTFNNTLRRITPDSRIWEELRNVNMA